MNASKKLLLGLAAIVFVGSSLAASARAYVIIGSPWPGNPITITYGYNNVFDGGLKGLDAIPLPNSLIRSSIEEALQLWTTVVPINFVELPASSPVVPQLSFRHLYVNGPDPPPPGEPTTKALSSCLGYGTNCEVLYDDGDPWQEVGTLPVPDILGATIHEVGHTLGLYHTDVVGANMYWIFRRTNGLGTGQLHADDIAGMQAIYGAGSGTLATISGDFNSDGAIDAADYVLWRKGLGTTYTQDDYVTWRTHLRQRAGDGGISTDSMSSQSAMPEPNTALLVLTGSAWLWRSIQRRR